jgi:phosphate/sulfate permease
MAAHRKQFTQSIEYVPTWVIFGVALALGIGTMIGYKRIVVTVAEKIGKTHLTYAQGAAAEMVAAVTIGLADAFHMPVSTTHVLSSGVAGTMWANKSGLQGDTIRKIGVVWVVTMPSAILLAAGFFTAGGFLIPSARPAKARAVASVGSERPSDMHRSTSRVSE